MISTDKKSKNHLRIYLRRAVRFTVLLFLLINTIAYLHAWRFTHFTDSSEAKPKLEETGWGQKLKYAFTGMPNPRPENKKEPSQSFSEVRLNDYYNTAGWWIPCDSAIGTVIILHGYSGEKSSMLDKSEIFHTWGYNSLLIDFRGSGETPGNATSIGFHEAEQVKAAFAWAQLQSGKPLIILGTSMGAVAAMRAIAKYNIQPTALILECPFGSLTKTTKARFRQMGFPDFPMSSLLVFWGGVQQKFNGFKHNPSEYAEKISVPTLLLYGQKDLKVSQEETESIFANLKGPKSKTYFTDAGHENYLLRYEKEWKAAVTDFLN